MKASAILSDCRKWRYKLERIWSEVPPLVWIMLNPSTADEGSDDATIRRCMGFAMNWGYGGIEVYNLFAYRATMPETLNYCTDPVGPKNNQYLRGIPVGRQIIAAWGSFPQKLGHRDREVLMMFRDRRVDCLGVTKLGFPKHPVRLGYATKREVLIDASPVCTDAKKVCI